MTGTGTVTAGVLLTLMSPPEAPSMVSPEAHPAGYTEERAAEDETEPASVETTAESADEAGAGDSASGLAQQLTNPVADIMSFPLQSNFDVGAGPNENGLTYTMNFQPVVPVPLGGKVLLINRLIFPVVAQTAPAAVDRRAKGGLGDTTYSAFLAPRKPLWGKLIVGVGPVVNFRTTTATGLGLGQWGGGPTLVVLSLLGPFTVGALANHVRFEPGTAKSLTFIQPFFAYTFETATSITLQTETTFVEGPNSWTAPIAVIGSQVIPTKTVPLSLALGIRYFAAAPEQGPVWGARFALTVIVPRKTR